MLRTPGPLLLTVAESAQAFEAGLTAEVQKFPEFGLALARMAHYHGGAQHDSAHL